MVGDTAVGKSNLITRYIQNEFFQESKTTVGAEFVTKEVTLENGDIIKTQIWDTAGQERFRAITTAYYKDAAGALLVYDVTQYETFSHIQTWLKELKENADPASVVMLIGNKCDLEDAREVRTEEAQEFASKYDLFFKETSALDNQNVNDAFLLIFKEIYKKVQKQELGTDRNQSIYRPGSQQLTSQAKSERSVKLSAAKLKEEKKRKKGCCGS